MGDQSAELTLILESGEAHDLLLSCAVPSACLSLRPASSPMGDITSSSSLVLVYLTPMASSLCSCCRRNHLEKGVGGTEKVREEEEAAGEEREEAAG
eukprot:288465-Hanusia_phi.AAC.1